MEFWNRQRYEAEKRRFIQQRIKLAPVWTQFTLIFAASWATAWLASWALLHFFAAAHTWARSLPIRYSIAFACAYACFFLAVRVWIDVVRREPHQQSESLDLNGFDMGADAEGCMMVLALLLLGFIVGGIFFALGGAPLLLEAAFEAAFAGVVVRRLSGEFQLGDWKKRLFLNTWKSAVFGFMLLIGIAAWLQHQAPQAATFSEAVRAMKNNGK